MNFCPANDVYWLEKEHGIRFNSEGCCSAKSTGGIVFTPQPFKYTPDRNTTANAGSIELWIRSVGVNDKCRHRIASFLDEKGNETLFIGQWKSHFLVRLINIKREAEREYREIGIHDALGQNIKHFLTITSNHQGTCLYLDGELRKQYYDINLFSHGFLFQNQRLFLGNRLDLHCPWSGDIFGIALYSRKLNDFEVANQYKEWKHLQRQDDNVKNDTVAVYRFHEKPASWFTDKHIFGNHLYIPKTLIFKRPILLPPQKDRLQLADILLNIAGFVPFGFFFFLWLREKNAFSLRTLVLIVLSLGLLVSLIIELSQVYMPARNSSMTDLLTNTVGTFLGVFCAYLIINHKKRQSNVGSLR